MSPTTTAGRAPIAAALDTAAPATAPRWTTAVAPHVTTVKVGLELFAHEGPAAVEKVRAAGDVDVFLDLKLHDIPNTVAGAARSVAHLPPPYPPAPAPGAPAMIAAAAHALPDTLVA